MNPPPLTWIKATPFPVASIIAGPFGIFRGDTKGPDRGLRLAPLPTGPDGDYTPEIVVAAARIATMRPV